MEEHDQAYQTETTVRGLLSEISAKRPDWRITRKCAYTNGKDVTCLELNVRSSDSLVIKAVYIYQTGAITGFHCKNYAGTRAKNIVDFLLDLLCIKM